VICRTQGSGIERHLMDPNSTTPAPPTVSGSFSMTLLLTYNIVLALVNLLRRRKVLGLGVGSDSSGRRDSCGGDRAEIVRPAEGDADPEPPRIGDTGPGDAPGKFQCAWG
jgi:hypothetical protein